MSDVAPQPILEFRALRHPARPPLDGPVDVSALTLRAGDVAVVLMERDGARPPLADLAMGLLKPVEGDVFFAGLRWDERSPDEQAAARHRIGRIFDHPLASWISNLDVDENVTLPLRYHGGLLASETLARIEALARQAGCWPLPESRPVATARDVLKRLEWVRALAPEPDLLLLERPLREVHGDHVPFLQLTRQAAERGAAILWLTTAEREWHDAAAFATVRLHMRGGSLLKAENG